MTGPVLIAHPVTGEVIDDPEQVAREWVRLTAAIAEANHEVNHLLAARAAIEPAMRACVDALDRVDGTDAWVVAKPPTRRPSQRVDVTYAQAHREVLDGLGLGGDRTTYQPPTAAQVRAHGADLVARGLDVARLLPEPPPAPAELAIVPKEA